eukprot:937819-Alexandrium_andersonii.AAC.1
MKLREVPEDQAITLTEIVGTLCPQHSVKSASQCAGPCYGMVPMSLKAFLPGLDEVMAIQPGANAEQRGKKANGPLIALL